MKHDPLDFDRPFDAPLEYVRVSGPAKHPLDDAFRTKVAIHTVHDGFAIPHEYRYRPDTSALVDPDELSHRYVAERDWGANLVAKKLASALGLDGYARVTIARVLLDFNRFPGSTPFGYAEDDLDRMAISEPYSDVLNHQQKTQLLENYYDAISARMEQLMMNRLIGIAIHTYDEHNASATKRADVSIVSQPKSYHRESRLTWGVFDPIYPDALAESTCSRILRDRISLNLERAGIRVSHNHPYLMPDGSIEVRAQVWFFFRYLKRRFEEEHPETKDDPAYKVVWEMLTDTNLRLESAEALRSYLHRFRKVSPDKRPLFEDALHAYSTVYAFRQTSGVVSEYRSSPDRFSAMGIEVRKDLLCSFDSETGRPLPPTAEQEDAAQEIADTIAGALSTYFETDRQYPVITSPPTLARER